MAMRIPEKEPNVETERSGEMALMTNAATVVNDYNMCTTDSKGTHIHAFLRNPSIYI